MAGQLSREREALARIACKDLNACQRKAPVPVPDGESNNLKQTDSSLPEFTRGGDLVDSAAPAVDLLHRAAEARATDIHLDPHQDYADVRFRIDGRLVPCCRLKHQEALALV